MVPQKGGWGAGPESAGQRASFTTRATAPPALGPLKALVSARPGAGQLGTCARAQLRPALLWSQRLSEPPSPPPKPQVTTALAVRRLHTAHPRRRPEQGAGPGFRDEAPGRGRRGTPARAGAARHLVRSSRVPSPSSGRHPARSPGPSPRLSPTPGLHRTVLKASTQVGSLRPSLHMVLPPESPPRPPFPLRRDPAPAHHDGEGTPPSPQALALRGRPPARRDTEPSERATPRRAALHSRGAERSATREGAGRAFESAQAQQIETRN